MKRVISVIIVIVMALTAASCSDNNTATDNTQSTQPQKIEYKLSDNVKEGSVIDGVMTDISADNEVLTKTTASWLDTAVIYEVNVRQYTEEGTFSAFCDSLKRLKDTGINTLWFMPIHPISKTDRKGTLGSYYAVDDYTAINPEFGNIDDFKDLVNKAHDMGFKVMLDWVANHTGWDNKWIKEHPDWYMRDPLGEITYPYDWSDVAELNYDNYEMRAEMIKSMQYWVEDIGVDGFRCDHAVGVPSGFWNAAVYKLKSINSELMFLAEASAAQSLTEYAFDSCYNDNFYGQACILINGNSPGSLAEGMKINSNYCDGSFPMNYLDNHDKNAYNGTIVSNYGDYYPTALALTYIMPGVPMIYTSNEIGYDHSIEFFEKDAVDWSGEYKYQDLLRYLSKTKSKNPALASTETQNVEILETNNNMVFAFVRTSGNNKVMYIGNFSEEEQSGISCNLPAGFENGAKCAVHYTQMILDAKGRQCSADDMKILKMSPMEFYVFTIGETE